MATSEQVMSVMAIIAAAYPGAEPQVETIKLYIALLANIPAQNLEQAALLHISRSPFFPTIAELLDASRDVRSMAEHTPLAAEAWGEVAEQIRKTGHSGKPQFSHPLVEQAVHCLGWRTLCLSDNPVADRAHFIKNYDTLLKREKNQHLINLLPGSIEPVRQLQDQNQKED